jgi:biotin-(acetyl-CoA carboxylase) ligase
MLALSDTDRGAQPGWPPGTVWTRQPAARLAPGWRRAWDWMCGAPGVWTASLPEEAGGGIACLIAVHEAPRSQFAVWRQVRDTGGIPDGGIVSIADRGMRFQGQRNRTWTALEGNIHLCACFRPGPRAAAVDTGWTLLPAVATIEAVREVCGDRVAPGIKWVNDIWVEGRKVAGVLTATRLRRDAVEQVVFGIGLNVREAPGLPASLPGGPAAGCLRELAGMPDLAPGHLLFPLVRAIARGYRTLAEQGSQPLWAAYRRDSLVIGRRVRIWQEADDAAAADSSPRLLAEGVVASIEPDLSLRLVGHAEPIREGRLSFVDPSRDGVGL